MSGLNFNSTDNQPRTIKDAAYVSIALTVSITYNDYNLQGASNISVTSGNSALITGIRPLYDGQVLTITNDIEPGRVFGLQHLGEGSAEIYKMDLTANQGGANLGIEYRNTAVLKYNNNINYWVLISYSKI
jgi:hypothetical protein